MLQLLIIGGNREDFLTVKTNSPAGEPIPAPVRGCLSGRRMQAAGFMLKTKGGEPYP